MDGDFDACQTHGGAPHPLAHGRPGVLQGNRWRVGVTGIACVRLLKCSRIFTPFKIRSSPIYSSCGIMVARIHQRSLSSGPSAPTCAGFRAVLRLDSVSLLGGHGSGRRLGDGVLRGDLLQVAAALHRDLADWHRLELGEALLEREGEAGGGRGARAAGKDEVRTHKCTIRSMGASKRLYT